MFLFLRKQDASEKVRCQAGSDEGLVLNEDQIRTVAAQVAEQLQSIQQNTSTSAISCASSTSAASSGASETISSSASGNFAIDLGAESMAITSTESVFQALDYNVSNAVKQKIIIGEYIDLGQLLQRRPGPDRSKCLTIEVGNLVVQSKPFIIKELPTSINGPMLS